jgi:hypothetical protein
MPMLRFIAKWRRIARTTQPDGCQPQAASMLQVQHGVGWRSADFIHAKSDANE